MKKIILISAFIFISPHSFSQTVSIADLQNFTSRSKKISEQDLKEKGFYLSQFKVIRDFDTVWAYRKGDESVYLGDSWITKENRKLKSVTYMTSNQAYFVELMNQIKSNGFNYENDKPDAANGGKWIYLSNNFYSIEIFITTKEGEFNSIMIVEK